VDVLGQISKKLCTETYKLEMTKTPCKRSVLNMFSQMQQVGTLARCKITVRVWQNFNL